MIVELNSFIGHKKIGSKAQSLLDLNRYGFNVPKGIALDTDIYLDITSQIKKEIDVLMQKLTLTNIEEIGEQISFLFDKLTIDDTLLKEIKQFMVADEQYLLRLSIDGNDSQTTFPGIFKARKNVTIASLKEDLIQCYKELFSYNSLFYILKKKIDYQTLALALIMQKQIISDTYVSVTTLNPITLNSEELMIDYTVDNKTTQYIYNFMQNSYNISADNQKKLDEIILLTKKIMYKFGYPLEIEMVLTKNEIFVLQVKELSALCFSNKEDLWLKAKINAKNFNFSLIFHTYDNFINKVANNLYQPSMLSFNQCYQNILCLSLILDNVITYDDELFKKEFKTNIKRKKSFKSSYKRLTNRKKYKTCLIEYQNNYDNNDEKYQLKYQEYCQKLVKLNGHNIEKEWHDLVGETYQNLLDNVLMSKYIILIYQHYLYLKLKKYLNSDEFIKLINIKEKKISFKIDQVFHQLVKKIYNKKESYDYWFSSPTLKILNDYEQEINKYYLPEFRSYIDKYGYLSNYYFDLSENFYVEDVEQVIRKIKKALANFEDIEAPSESTLILNKLKDKMAKKKFLKLEVIINKLQTIISQDDVLVNHLWKFNFLTKRYTKMLAKHYINKKIITNINDIWFLDIEDIDNYIDGEIDATKLQNKVMINKFYYNAYRNFSSLEILGSIKDNMKIDYQGVGYSSRIITGYVRIAKSLDELANLTEDDILITKKVNVNLLCQIPSVKGIIVSDVIPNQVQTFLRELDIPCLFLEDSTKKLKDKMMIKIDSQAGKVEIMKH